MLAIEKHCRTANDCLRKLAAVLPDAASLNFLDFTSCNRSDPDALQKLLDEIKILRVLPFVVFCCCLYFEEKRVV